MNSTTAPLQDSVNFFFTLLVYVPVNLIAMAMVWGIMALLNQVLRLRFSAITLSAAAGLLVFAMMSAWLDEVNSNRGWVSFREAPTDQYLVTLVLAGINVVLAALLSGVVWFFRRGKGAPPPLPVEPQAGKLRFILAGIWLALTLAFGSLPFLRQGGEMIADAQNEARLRKLADVVARNDIPAFQKALDEDGRLWDRRLLGAPDEPLFDELIRQDKVELAAVLLQENKLLFDYSFDWEIRSPAMVDMLVKQGMNRDRLTLELVETKDATLLQHMLERHRPLFFKWVDTMILVVMRDQNEAALELLVKHGIAGNAEQADAALTNRAHANDFAGMKLLVEKGFALNPKNTTIPYKAIYHANLPMLQWLLEQQPFNVNGKYDGYTHLEHAIIGGKKDIFDLLLSRNPDVQTLHETKLNGMTNALLLAERYKRPEMLAALKAHTAAGSGTGN